ncbi:hypothetical protein COBT_000426 [Conglomerata obtusa]
MTKKPTVRLQFIDTEIKVEIKDNFVIEDKIAGNTYLQKVRFVSEDLCLLECYAKNYNIQRLHGIKMEKCYIHYNNPFYNSLLELFEKINCCLYSSLSKITTVCKNADISRIRKNREKCLIFEKDPFYYD